GQDRGAGGRQEGDRLREPDPLLRAAALYGGQRPPHGDQAARRPPRAGWRHRRFHRRLAQEPAAQAGEGMTSVTLPGHIFREYDIRGLHATELTDDVAEAVGQAFATRIRAGAPAGGGSGARVALGQDVRPSSERLARAAERGMMRSGLTVERLGVVPTPALYFATVARGLDGGMQITGSHNPPEFNGFK